MYILTLFILLAIYFGIIYSTKFMKRTGIFNVFFAIFPLILYIPLVLIVYFDVGFNDWNFQNVLPTANVSPFMSTICALFLVLPNKVKKYFATVISFLSFGMLLSPIIGCIRNATIHYAFHPHFLLDYLAHIVLSAWGIYLVKTNQVVDTTKDRVISALFVPTIALIMLILNVIFDTAFFGLNLHGKHSIYNVVFTSNSYVNAIVYFVGLFLIMLLGHFYTKYCAKALDAKFQKNNNNIK